MVPGKPVVNQSHIGRAVEQLVQHMQACHVEGGVDKNSVIRATYSQVPCTGALQALQYLPGVVR